ncbi:MAG: hypothetical protein CVU57_24100 [Deltaproteobacteria bacterium HGW-Deltaproteobacteria-15]|jgi:type I restriction enzyme S subunit|nr:MAG: hypothetical protein CVU57_24100 [Deltaproteobacteria bacterium HGW-Deltaproteobacteria-15]
MLPNLASSWKTGPLGELCDLIMGQAPKGDTYNDRGVGTRLIAGAGDFGPVTPMPKKWTTSPTKMGKKGDIILCVRATIGDLNWADSEYCYGRGVGGIRVNNRIDREFVWFWLEACKNHLLSLGRGATFKQISKKDIAGLPVPDLDLSEQRRIVARIKECMERVGEIEDLRRGADSNRSAIAAAARYEAFRSDHATYELSKIISEGPTNGLYKHSKFYGSGAQILRINNFSSGDVLEHPKGLKRLLVDESELHRYALKSGDIVLNRVNGSLDVVGKACLVESLYEPTVFESNMMRFTVDQERAYARYVLHFLASPLCRDQIKSRAKVIQQASINQKDVASFLIPLPPMEEQRKIVERLDAVCGVVNELAQCATDRLSPILQLRESILRKAFSGEL